MTPSPVLRISIHALLAESDRVQGANFGAIYGFQSTLSLRRATLTMLSYHFRFLFQSTLSLRRATLGTQINNTTAEIFQSTLTLRRATSSVWAAPQAGQFQSTLSLRRATATKIPAYAHTADFNPRSPCGERRPSGVFMPTINNFNPRSPCGERQQIPPNWPYRFCLKCQFKDGEKSKKAKGSASAQASSPAYEKNKVRIPWGDFECFRFAPIK